MKAVVYSTQLFEKEYLARSNNKKHDITLISNVLNLDTVNYARGKDGIVVSIKDDVSAKVIEQLVKFGVKFILTRSLSTAHIDKLAAKAAGIKVANIPIYAVQSTAEHIIMLILALNRKIVQASKSVKYFDFRLDGLEGFTLKDKTVGVIGMGPIAQRVAKILIGFGCNIIGFDPLCLIPVEEIEEVSLPELYQRSDIISLHAQPTEKTRNLIDEQSFSSMKRNVMLINASNGSLVNTKALIDALKFKKIGYYGADVFECENGFFSENHEDDLRKDPLLTYLVNHPNVLITPHQGFLTREALEEIAFETIKKLDFWTKAQVSEIDHNALNEI